MSTLQQALVMSRHTGGKWTKRTASGARAWTGITISTDGQKIAACVGTSGYLYTSTDGGSTFSERTTPGLQDWSGICGSDDGSKLFAITSNGSGYTSSDSGSSWTLRFSGLSGAWYGCDSSASGTHLVACAAWDSVNNAYPRVSGDSGANWTDCTAAGNGAWWSCCISSDGQKVVVAEQTIEGAVKRSTNGGTGWTSLTPPAGYWLLGSTSSSDDGATILLSDGVGKIVRSTNSGANWGEVSGGPSHPINTRCSSDGSGIISAAYGVVLSTSLDDGSLWAEHKVEDAPFGDSKYCAISSDATHFAVAVSGGYIYTL